MHDWIIPRSDIPISYSKYDNSKLGHSYLLVFKTFCKVMTSYTSINLSIGHSYNFASFEIVNFQKNSIASYIIADR